MFYTAQMLLMSYVVVIVTSLIIIFTISQQNSIPILGWDWIYASFFFFFFPPLIYLITTYHPWYYTNLTSSIINTHTSIQFIGTELSLGFLDFLIMFHDSFMIGWIIACPSIPLTIVILNQFRLHKLITCNLCIWIFGKHFSWPLQTIFLFVCHSPTVFTCTLAKLFGLGSLQEKTWNNNPKCFKTSRYSNLTKVSFAIQLENTENE